MLRRRRVLMAILILLAVDTLVPIFLPPGICISTLTVHDDSFFIAKAKEEVEGQYRYHSKDSLATTTRWVKNNYGNLSYQVLRSYRAGEWVKSWKSQSISVYVWSKENRSSRYQIVFNTCGKFLGGTITTE